MAGTVLPCRGSLLPLGPRSVQGRFRTPRTLNASPSVLPRLSWLALLEPGWLARLETLAQAFLVTAVTDKFPFPGHTVAMKPGKLFRSEFAGYAEAVVGLLSFGFAVAILYELIRVACAHLFQ